MLAREMNPTLVETTTELDNALSNRHIDLDPGGYFIIYVDTDAKLIHAKHFSNFIDDRGVACDPETGKPIPCSGTVQRVPTRIFSGRTAKELCVVLFEQTQPCPVTRLDHASYLGREFQRAEAALLSHQPYVQD